MKSKTTNLQSSRLKGRFRCQKARKHQMDLWDKRSIAAAVPMASRKTLKTWLAGGITTDEVENRLRSEFDSIPFLSSGQKEAQLKDQMFYLTKYIEAEEHAQKSRNRFYVAATSKTIDLWGTPVDVTPDAVFFDEGRIETVKYFFKAPDIANFGKEKDKTVSRCLELLAFWKYGNTLATSPDDTVYAGYVFLGGVTDCKDPQKSDFGVIGPDNKYYRGLSMLSAEEDNVEDIFEKEWKHFLLGNSCEDDCSTCMEFCPWKNAGNYKEPPKSKEQTKGKKLGAISLSKAQENAITFERGVGRVKAGAGAGKTLVLTLRVMNLIMNGAAPESILLITFTVNGADEMRQRIRFCFDDYGLDPKESEKIHITTFNAFAQEVINDNWEKLGFTEKPNVVDSITRKALILQVTDGYRLSGVNYKNYEGLFGNGGFDTISQKFDDIKAYGLNLYNWENDEVLKEKLGLDESWMNAYTSFNSLLKYHNLLEYGDQQFYLEQIMLEDPYYIEGKYGFTHVIVDEFQDTSKKEIDLLKRLMDTVVFQSLFVVGDDAQNIFESMRHTSEENLINFGDIIGEDTVNFELDDNYRSTPEIIDLANKTNARRCNRLDSLLNAKRASAGDDVEAHLFTANKREYAYIASRIEEGIKTFEIKPESIAFIARDGGELKAMADELTSRGIPSQLLTPESVQTNSRVIAACGLADFLEDEDVTQGAFDYLNAISHGNLFNQSDDKILSAIEEFRVEIKNSVEEKGETETFFHYLSALDASDETFKQFSDKVEEKKTFKEVYEFCSAMERLGGKEKYRRKAYSGEGVILTTVHSSKGLEWPVVYLSISKFDSGSNMEENRRILFTAITRAKDKLIVTATVGKRRNNVFVTEILEDIGKKFTLEDEAEKKEEVLEDLEERKRIDTLIKAAKIRAEETRKKRKISSAKEEVKPEESEEVFF